MCIYCISKYYIIHFINVEVSLMLHLNHICVVCPSKKMYNCVYKNVFFQCMKR